MQKKSSQNFMREMTRGMRVHGEAVFLAALLLVVTCAAWLFAQFIYPPIFTPREPALHPPPFTPALYQQVIKRIQDRPQKLADELQRIPPDPFRAGE